MENTSMTQEQKNTCIMCRRQLVMADGSKTELERLRGWAEKGKSWAMALLAQRYKDGIFAWIGLQDN